MNSQQEVQQEHRRLFGQMSVTKLFFKCTLPSVVSMAASSLYTIADGIFVGRFIGAGALAAINLVMPVIMISFALSDMVAVGSSVQIAIKLGEQNTQKAGLIFTFACKIILAISVIMGIAGWFAAPALVSLLGAEGTVASMAVSYMRVYAAAAPFIMSFFAVDNYLRICGKLQYSMRMNLMISVANIVLDWLFIVRFGWGIGSAALASCLCLAAGNLICFYPFFRKKLVLQFTRGRLSIHQAGNLMANGSSEFFSNISSSVCMMLFNTVLMRLSGYLAVAAFSVVMYVDSVAKSILYGMSDSLQPAISYNYGAGRRDRLFALERRAVCAGFLFSVAVMLWMLIGGDSLISLFIQENNEELIAMSIRAMKLFSFSYLVSFAGIICSSFFTALNRPLASLTLSACQTFLFPVLCLSFLPALLGLDGVWLTSLAAGTMTASLAGILTFFVVRSCKKEQPAAD